MFNLFPREQVLVLKYESLRDDPFRVVETMFDFLRLPRVRAIKNKHRNVGSYSRKITAQERAYATALFDADIAKVEAMLGWNCSDWRTNSSASVTGAS